MNRTLKKSLVWGALSLSAAFAAAAVAEWNGYHAFDQPNGWNSLCAIDPACRHITSGEIAMARSVFGDEINYKAVKIFSRSHFALPLNGIFNWARNGLGLDVDNIFALAPNGNIYVADDTQYSDDFSRSGYQAGFLHELTHVWQVQKGINIRQEAADAFIANNFDYGGLYKYNLDTHEDFYDFNHEQQAEIVENYFEERKAVRTRMDLFGGDLANITAAGMKEAIGDHCRNLIPLEDKLVQELPIQPEAACRFIRDEKPDTPKPRKKRRMSPRR
jgi:hypothetical protein